MLLFPIVLMAPVADEFIGRLQFYRLCEKEAVVTLSADWQKVKRAKRTWLARNEFENYVIPIHSQGLQFTDLDTGQVFMTSQSLLPKVAFLCAMVLAWMELPHAILRTVGMLKFK